MNRILLLLMISLVITAVSCKKRTIKKINEDLIEGTWKVERFRMNGTDLTANYTSQIFEFTEDGFIHVTDTVNISGAWKVSKQVSTDDPLDNFLECAISLPYPMNDLAGFWNVFAYEPNRLELQYNDTLVSKELTFVQN